MSVDTTCPYPACGRAGTLMALGARRERPHHWRPWISAAVDLFLCACCDALVTRGPTERLVVESRPHPQSIVGGPRPRIAVHGDDRTARVRRMAS